MDLSPKVAASGIVSRLLTSMRFQAMQAVSTMKKLSKRVRKKVTFKM